MIRANLGQDIVQDLQESGRAQRVERDKVVPPGERRGVQPLHDVAQLRTHHKTMGLLRACLFSWYAGFFTSLPSFVGVPPFCFPRVAVATRAPVASACACALYRPRARSALATKFAVSIRLVCRSFSVSVNLTVTSRLLNSRCLLFHSVSRSISCGRRKLGARSSWGALIRVSRRVCPVAPLSSSLALCTRVKSASRPLQNLGSV